MNPWSPCRYPFFLVTTAWMLSLSCSRTLPASNRSELDVLADGIVFERVLTGEEQHDYRLLVEDSQLAMLSVLSRDAAITLSFHGPEGNFIEKKIFSPGEQATLVTFLAEEAGFYRVTLSANGNRRTPYRLKYVSCRTATHEEISRAWVRRTASLAECLFDEGHYREALAVFEHALPVWEELGDGQEQGMMLRGIGLANKNLGRDQQALADFDFAMAYLSEPGDDFERMRLLKYCGSIYYKLGLYDANLEVCRQALELARRLDDRHWQAVLLNDIGAVYYKRGQPERALGHYFQALQYLRYLNEPKNTAFTLLNMGTSYMLLDRSREALEALEGALEGFRSTGASTKVTEVLIEIGWVHTMGNDLDDAMDYFHQAANLVGLQDDRRLLASYLDKYGTALRRMGQLDEAEMVYREARSLWEGIGAVNDWAQTTTNLARTLLLTGNPAEASDLAQAALGHFRAIDDPHGRAFILFLLATIDRDSGKLQAARGCMEEALSLLEEFRDETSARQNRISFAASRLDYYLAHIELLMEMEKKWPDRGYATLAFEAAERIRAREFLSELALARADASEDLPPDLLALEKDMQEALNRGEWQAFRDAGFLSELMKDPSAWEHEAMDKLYWVRDLIRLQTEHRLDRPRQASETIREVQRDFLDEDTLILVYTMCDKRSYLWLLTTDSLEYHEIPRKEKIENAIREYHQLLGEGYKKSNQKKIALYARQLSDWLLAPIASRLPGKRLVVIGDGVLPFLSFGALPLPSPRDETRFLIEECEIVALPSLSTLAVIRETLADRPEPVNELAVLADPVYQLDDPRVKTTHSPRTAPEPATPRRGDPDLLRSSRDLGIDRFQRLPHSRAEAEAISALALGGDTLKALDFQASLQTVRTAALGTYRIVHFASHGLLHPRYGELSGLVLSLIDEQGRPIDGFLRAHEVRGLDLPVDLVVLSACRTALGKEIQGEGLVGLSRAFMIAGAASVLVSLWDVNDEATAELMTRFYRFLLQRGMSPAEALRAAQRSMLQTPKWHDPYFWAGFVLQGEWRSLRE